MKDPRLNKGVFNFMAKQGYDIHQMRQILFSFADQIGKRRPKKGRLEWYVEISEDAAADFSAFKKFFNKNKPVIGKKSQSYDEWWQEANMDGSFAYNGVTEDF